MTNQLNPLSGRVLLAAFEGWSDAGGAATATLDWLGDRLDVDRVHTIGAEGYVDYQVHRPKVFLDDDGSRAIEWPDTILYGPVAKPVAPLAGEPAAADDPPDTERVRRVSGDPVTELFLLSGVEPARNWQAFAEEIIDLVETWGIDTVILLGSLFSDAPHSRPITSSLRSDDPALRARLDAERSDYEGPTGISGVLGVLLTAAGVPALSLWASVPHYVHSAPSPKATLSLIDKLEEVLDIVVPRGELLEQAATWERNINQIAEGDDDMTQYIQRLENQRDAIEAPEATGDAIAYEFEKFLQEPPAEPAEPAETPDGSAGSAPAESPESAGPPETAGHPDAAGHPETAERTDPAGQPETPGAPDDEPEAPGRG